jgi:hypothetical protein
MKKTRSLMILLMGIGLVTVFLVSKDTFALAPITIACPPTAKLKATYETLYSGSDWQPVNMTATQDLLFNKVSIYNVEINCSYTMPASAGSRLMLKRNFPTGYKCAVQTSPPNTVICTPIPTR